MGLEGGIRGRGRPGERVRTWRKKTWGQWDIYSRWPFVLTGSLQEPAEIYHNFLVNTSTVFPPWLNFSFAPSLQADYACISVTYAVPGVPMDGRLSRGVAGPHLVSLAGLGVAHGPDQADYNGEESPDVLRSPKPDLRTVVR